MSKEQIVFEASIWFMSGSAILVFIYRLVKLIRKKKENSTYEQIIKNFKQ